MRKRYINPGASLVAQYLRLSTANAEQPVSIPGQGTRSCIHQLRPGAANLLFFLSINIKEAEKKEREPSGQAFQSCQSKLHGDPEGILRAASTLLSFSECCGWQCRHRKKKWRFMALIQGEKKRWRQNVSWKEQGFGYQSSHLDTANFLALWPWKRCYDIS